MYQASGIRVPIACQTATQTTPEELDLDLPSITCKIVALPSAYNQVAHWSGSARLEPLYLTCPGDSLVDLSVGSP